MGDLDLATFLLALLAGAVRVGTPFLFVSLGECLTEKSGRINLGLEGILVAGAMTHFGDHRALNWVGANDDGSRAEFALTG